MEAIEEFYRGVQLAISRNEEIRVRLMQENEQEVWARMAAKGWSEFTERS
jgi:hypothetical protein